ncbi:MAG: hypothetical protein ACI4FY_06320 [Acetatifactor sp.]
MKIVEKLVHIIYTRVFQRWFPVPRNVEEGLSRLHPGQKREQLIQSFYEEKIRLVLLICLAGVLFGGMAKLAAGKQSILRGDNSILRGGFEDGVNKIALVGKIQDREDVFQIRVAPRQLTTGEVIDYVDSFRREIGSMILGENVDLEHVITPLNLLDSYEGYPFEVSWESGDSKVLDSGGKIGTLLQDRELLLHYTLRYGQYEYKGEIPLVLHPPDRTKEEQRALELARYLEQEEENSRGQDSFVLPEKWQGSEIAWSVEGKDYSTVLWCMTPILAVLLFFLKDQDIQKELENRTDRLRQEYPELVHKLVLYIGAGMSVRGAFAKIAREYEKRREKSSEESFCGEELVLLCRQLQAGTMEDIAIDSFGRRVGVREYIRLSTLLVQNRKRGNQELLSRLLEEADTSLEEQLLSVRKSGEEAGTKLLIPMVCMLGIVMVIIMVPAFGTI